MDQGWSYSKKKKKVKKKRKEASIHAYVEIERPKIYNYGAAIEASKFRGISIQENTKPENILSKNFP